jgi:hypothetical protein
MIDDDLRITLKDLYQAQQESTRELTAAIHGVESAVTKMTGHLEVIDTRNRNADLLHADYETRLRALERWRYALPTSIIRAFGSVFFYFLNFQH